MPRRRFVDRKRRYHPRWVKKSASARGYSLFSPEKASGVYDAFVSALLRKPKVVGEWFYEKPRYNPESKNYGVNFGNIAQSFGSTVGSMLGSYVNGKVYHYFASSLDSLGERRRFDRARFNQAFGEVRSHLPPHISDEAAAEMLAGMMDENPYSSSVPAHSSSSIPGQ